MGMAKPSVWLPRLRALGVMCFSRSDLRHARTRFGMQGLVETHHVIPRCCASHATLRRMRFDTEDGANFALMPTRRGMERLSLRPDRLVHGAGGHMAYNAFVWDRLDGCVDEDDLLGLLVQLHRGMRVRSDEIPWNGRGAAA